MVREAGGGCERKAAVTSAQRTPEYDEGAAMEGRRVTGTSS